MATPSEIWAFMGRGEKLVGALNQARELHLSHGLTLGTPMSTTNIARVAGITLTQVITESNGVTIVSRQ
jgi:hypothetical protein